MATATAVSAPSIQNGKTQPVRRSFFRRKENPERSSSLSGSAIRFPALWIMIPVKFMKLTFSLPRSEMACFHLLKETQPNWNQGHIDALEWYGDIPRIFGTG